MQRFKRQVRQHSPATDALLQNVWTFDAGGTGMSYDRTSAYINHYTNILQSNQQLVLTLGVAQNHSRIPQLVSLVKAQQCDDIESIKTAIKDMSVKWNGEILDDIRSCQVLRFVLKLWLFADPAVQKPTQTVPQAMDDLLAVTPNSSTKGPAADVLWLSPDFSAKTLTRKAGFYLVWTSDLAEHLTFISKTQLRVFRHAAILKRYQSGPERDFYPDGFLEETYKTIHLLFPFEDLDTSRKVRKIAKKRRVDIEASAGLEDAMDEYAKYQIGTYQYYGSRLAEIQRRYDLARPRRLQQWWYDRRQRQEWGALMIALVVFALTIFFGLISSITGIMQVWASFAALKS